MTFIAPSFSHGKKELEITHRAFSKALQSYLNALNGGADKLVFGQKVQPVFRKYN
jgi:glutamate-1-semialdehyde 2,1-aminomutase